MSPSEKYQKADQVAIDLFRQMTARLVAAADMMVSNEITVKEHFTKTWKEKRDFWNRALEHLDLDPSIRDYSFEALWDDYLLTNRFPEQLRRNRVSCQILESLQSANLMDKPNDA